MYHPIGFRLLLENYFHGTLPQKNNALLRLVQAIIHEPEAAVMLMGVMRSYSREDALEILLQIAERLDIENYRADWENSDVKNMMKNTVRFYSSAGELVKSYEIENRKMNTIFLRPNPKVSSSGNSGSWSEARIRKELISLYRKHRCIRKATAESLMMSPDKLRLGIFPRYGIDEERVKRDWIREALEESRGNVRDAAVKTGLTLRTYRQKLIKYGIKDPQRSRKIARRYVDRLPVAQAFMKMYHSTDVTATRDPKTRKFCLVFFREVERLYHGKFNTERERKAVFRFLRLSAARNRLRIEFLYKNLFGHKIPLNITEASRYKFCSGLLRNIFIFLTAEDGRDGNGRLIWEEKITDLLFALKVWALRHWTERPLVWADYRRAAKETLCPDAEKREITSTQKDFQRCTVDR